MAAEVRSALPVDPRLATLRPGKFTPPAGWPSRIRAGGITWTLSGDKKRWRFSDVRDGVFTSAPYRRKVPVPQVQGSTGPVRYYFSYIYRRLDHAEREAQAYEQWELVKVSDGL